MAEVTVNIDDKAQWLQMAETWMRLAHQSETVLPPTSQPLIAPAVPGEPDKIN